MVVSDLHRHVINLAMVVRNQGDKLATYLNSLPFHPETLANAQAACRAIESDSESAAKFGQFGWAADFFVCSWMARNGTAGTEGEFKAGLSVRWEAGGGDSAIRFWSAVESIAEWSLVMRRCTFVSFDVFDFLAKAKDIDENGLYLDPPFPEVGDKYEHPFDEVKHRLLAEQLVAMEKCRVVCRFYDHPLIRKLYPESGWIWNRYVGRKQTNEVGPEVLLVRNG